MKRPLLLFSISFLVGILLSENIIWTTLIVVLFLTCFFIKKDYGKVMVLIIVSFLIGNTYIKIYENIYTNEISRYDGITAKVSGIVYYSLDEETYLIKNVKIENNPIKSNIRIKALDLSYGDEIESNIKLKVPNGSRNKGSFDYRRYLKTQKIYLTGTAKEVKILGKNKNNILETFCEKIRMKIREFTQDTVDKKYSGILEASITGDDRKIEEEIEEQYKKAGMIHLLVVSGGHVAFLILLVKYIFKLIKVGIAKETYILISVIIIYMFITGLTPSVLRAGIAVIIGLIAQIVGRENDTLTTIGLVILILLVDNPNIIYSLSFQLSFLGALGIILGYSKLNKIKKIPSKISEAIALTISAQLFVTPITLYNFNTIYLGGLVSNIFSMELAGIIMMLGIILFPVYLILPPLSKLLMKVVEILIGLMNLIAKIFSNIPLFNLTLPTPNILQIIIYYIVVIYLLDIDYRILIKPKEINTNLPIQYRNKLHKKIGVISLGVVSILLISAISYIIPKPLEISVIDVGHGDSILITTPHKKSILIDTGDSYLYNEKIYDSGENTVVPYLLDKGYKKIDLLVLSHLDSDHIGGLKSISENIEIGQIGISINNKMKEKGKVVEDIIKNEGAKRIYLKKGQSFTVDGVNFRVLLPEKKDVIDEENNDSIVILMEHQGIKTLFMGDLEAEEEEKLINNVRNLDIDILKVGHHGSITSTTENFVKSTTPSISLISVGTRFKSIPGEEVINRLKSVHSKIYRTDKNGEIVVKIDKGKMYVETRY